ncbi:chemotaxis protein CheX [Trujillonella humicola]|uniref:chemotaxis protein CheX n=1 Tax=Trujillonella humicola TaxID=3383699 RepID=UPI003906866C
MNATLVTSLLDEATVTEIAEQAWSALVGEEEFLVPLPAPLPAGTTSSWVTVTGPWNGVVVVTCGTGTAGELTRALLREHAPAQLEAEDVEDALGEIANVVGGNVKAVLPGPSVLGLPETGSTPPVPGPPEDTCRVEFLWRGQPLTITAQGSPRTPAQY